MKIKLLSFGLLAVANCATATWIDGFPTRGIVAHRGDAAEFPENTVLAFDSAVAKGAEMIELDEWRCKTGELIVMHDSRVDRTTNGAGKISDLTLDEIRRLDAGVRRDPKFAGAKVPTLIEAIERFPRTGILLNIHCKTGSAAPEVAELLRKTGRLSQGVLMMDSRTDLILLKAKCPWVKTGLVMNTDAGWEKSWTADEAERKLKDAADLGVDYVQILPNSHCTHEQLRYLHDRGVRTTYFAANSEKTMREIVDEGHDFIFTDRYSELRPIYEDQVRNGSRIRGMRGASAAVCAEEIPDPRTRSYVYPTRVVWQTPVPALGFRSRFAVTNALSLLERKRGQVPELGNWVLSMCRLVNRGEVPGLVVDFGRELHGGVQLAFDSGTPPGMRIRLRFGESVSEAMSDIGGNGATNDHAMRDMTLDVPHCGTITVGDTGFRFVRLDLITTGEIGLDFVRAVSLMRPMPRLGWFRCSDERINRVFETAVRTVHLCCQERLWDGIKRDRLVWMGDMHPETMAILNVFGAAPILQETFDYGIAVTDPKEKWMNNIVTYTLWWMRNMSCWYQHTGDVAYLRRHHDYLSATVDRVLSCLTPSNTLESADRVILDWPTEHNKPARQAGMQALAVMALRETADLAVALADAPLEDRCRQAADRLASQSRLDPNGSKQAAALLALAGMADPKEMYDRVLGRNGHEGVSTFYGYYLLEAMSAAGEDRRALETVRDYWGAMLDVGATSFWEDFKLSWTNNCSRIDELPVAGKPDIHGDYGEFCYPGFRHSLCHGWSSGPAAWLINHVLGIRPFGPGCRRISVKPFLGDLDWAEGAMALPGNACITVRVERAASGAPRVTVSAPSGVDVVRETEGGGER